MIPPQVDTWLVENQYGPVAAQRPVGGGCINNGVRLTTVNGSTFFLKTNPTAPPDMFAREADGLDILRTSDGPRVPQSFVHAPEFLLLEDLAPAPRQSNYWTVFGYQLAALHNHTGDQFGFYHDNYIGSTPQPNAYIADGYVFFSQQRLLYMAGLAVNRGLLDKVQFRKVKKIATGLQQLVPEQPPSLLHGDLWSGNALTGSSGEPALIDPAAHYGWGEAELAMTNLFGSFPAAFYKAYQEIRPLEPGLESRFPIYNLYHLLNHLVLFGQGYWGQVSAILSRYG